MLKAATNIENSKKKRKKPEQLQNKRRITKVNDIQQLQLTPSTLELQAVERPYCQNCQSLQRFPAEGEAMPMGMKKDTRESCCTKSSENVSVLSVQGWFNQLSLFFSKKRANQHIFIKVFTLNQLEQVILQSLFKPSVK